MELMPRIGKSLMHIRAPHPPSSLSQKLTQGQTAVLCHVCENTATMRELAALANVTMPTMTEIVARLVTWGLVDRCPDAKDRRIVRIRITAKGRSEFHREFQRGRKLFVKVLSPLTEHEQDELIRAFETIDRILVNRSQHK
jgi:DNA-binding MarR family transcriptional regulator